MDIPSHIMPLGFLRLRILACLGGDSPSQPGYFNPPAEADIFVAFQDHVTHLSRKWAADTQPIMISLLAAARLLTGELPAAYLILDHLPANPARVKYGANYCPLASQRTLAAVLQLPHELKDPDGWLRGSAEQAALCTWLDSYADELIWLQEEARYVFP